MTPQMNNRTQLENAKFRKLWLHSCCQLKLPDFIAGLQPIFPKKWRTMLIMEDIDTESGVLAESRSLELNIKRTAALRFNNEKLVS